METIEIKHTERKIVAAEAMLNQSTFNIVCLDDSVFAEISAKSVKIMDANLTDLEIQFAQLGGAYIHNVGLPPDGHPAYIPGAKQRPLRFENCDLNGSIINNCDLSNVNIIDCKFVGMKIDGILIEDLLNKFKS